MLMGAMACPGFADTLELTGIVRDFKRGDQAGGHPDFQTASMSGRGGFGLVKGLVTSMLGTDGKPVYNPTRPSKDTILSEGSFGQWFRDVSDVNLSAPLTLSLSNGSSEAGGVYTYQNNAFWPINGMMFGNQGLTKNFHFTFELNTVFTYEPGQKFTFIGDDDVWVYVNGRLVIDLGGVHSAETGSVILFDGKAFVSKAHFNTGNGVEDISSAMLADLSAKWTAQAMEGQFPISSTTHRVIDLGMNPGDSASLHFFFAERHTTQSNFRIDTSIQLEAAPLTTVSPLYD